MRNNIGLSSLIPCAKIAVPHGEQQVAVSHVTSRRLGTNHQILRAKNNPHPHLYRRTGWHKRLLLQGTLGASLEDVVAEDLWGLLDGPRVTSRSSHQRLFNAIGLNLPTHVSFQKRPEKVSVCRELFCYNADSDTDLIRFARHCEQDASVLLPQFDSLISLYTTLGERDVSLFERRILYFSFF